jgi:hypothetical protein
MGSWEAGLPKASLRSGLDDVRPQALSASDTRLTAPGRRVALVRDSLFPATGARRTRNPTVVFVAYVLAAAAGFSVDLWWSGSGITSRVWAEDGTVFLSAAYRTPYFLALAHPYAGYLQVLPRSLAALTTAFPLRDAAWVLAASAAAARVAVSLFVFRASSGHLRSTLVRAMLASAVVLLPVGGLEVLDNIANLHWFFTFAAFWAVLWRPARRWECVLAAAMLMVAVDSDPLTALLLPLVVLRAISLRRWRDQIVTGCFAAAGVVQTWAVLSGTRPAHETFSASTIARLFGVRVLVGALTGYWHTVALWRHLHYASVALGAVAVVALISPALRVGGSRRWLAIWAAGGSALAFAACFAEPAVVPHLQLDVISSLTRYDVLASLLMLTAVAAGLDALRWPANLAVCGFVGVVFLSALPVDLVGSAQLWTHLESTVPSWRTAIANAKVSCRTETDARVRGGATDGRARSDGEVWVLEMPEGWRVRLPCSAVDP